MTESSRRFKHSRTIRVRPVAANSPAAKTTWRIRVGDYRVVYEIADEIRVMRFNRVRHRREAYR